MEKASNSRANSRTNSQAKDTAASSAGALTEAANEQRMLTLVAAEIIPRLIRAYQDPCQVAQDQPAIFPEEVEAFAQALLAQNIPLAHDIVVRLSARGLGMDCIYLQLFTDAARYLGVLWENDQCNFSQVTLCLWRMQTMLYDLSPSFHSSAKHSVLPGSAEHRILLGSLPGQQHTFGLSMLAEFFRREGWDTLSVPSPQSGELLDSLSLQWFDVLALTASMDGEIKELGKIIKSGRKASRNPHLAVLVGGPLFLRQPELAALVGADGMAADAPSALALAAKLVQHQKVVRLN